MNSANKLRTCFLCRDLDETELAALAVIASLRRLDKGEMLFWEGDPAAGFYVLLSGSVRVYKASPEGKEYTIHQIRPGQIFAEAAIFSGGGYPANCSALAESEVAFFPKDRFIELITRSPQISLKMIASLSAFVREFNRMVEDLSLHEVPARLARFLIDEHARTKSDVVQLETSKTELAGKLGTISETLSRNFKKLSELGCIEVRADRIALLDLPRLEAIANGEKF